MSLFRWPARPVSNLNAAFSMAGQLAISDSRGVENYAGGTDTLPIAILGKRIRPNLFFFKKKTSS